MGLQSLCAVVRGKAQCRQSGATAVEYAIIASLIAGVIVATVRLVGPALLPGFEVATAGL